MSKIGDFLIDIQENTWAAIEKYPSIEFAELVKEVATAMKQEEKFIAPMVEAEFLEYKSGFDNEGLDGYGNEANE